jgi:nitrogen PTS system EIIA component
MSTLASLLAENDIALGISIGNKRKLFEHVGALIEAHHPLAATVVIDSLLARERLGSTGLGEGVAIPHGRIRGLDHAIGAFLRPSTPVAFDAPDGKPVDQVFVLLVPENATDHHLLILSELAQRFSDKSFRDALRGAEDAKAVYSLFLAPVAG